VSRLRRDSKSGGRPPGSARVFISYRRQDCSGYTRLVHEHLEDGRGRGTVFMDLVAIQPGSDFVDVIEQAISQCDVLVAMIGQRWLSAASPAGRRIDDPNDFVRLEISTALERQIPVVPVLVEGAAMPRADQLPEALRPLARRNAVTLTDAGFADDVGRLAEELERLAPTGRGRLARSHLVGAFAALTVAFATVAVLLGGGRSGSDSIATPQFPPGTSLDAIQRRGFLIVGTKSDLAGVGREKSLSTNPSGFEPDIAILLATGIFGGSTADAERGRIVWKTQAAKDREEVITTGSVDIVIATFTINEQRKKNVSFGGPYFEARQDIMVRTENNDVKGVGSLAGRKVCTVEGSTSLENLRRHAPLATPVVELSTFRCAEVLRAGAADAVTGDDIVLASLVEQSDGAFKMLHSPFSREPHGIGFRKGDQAMCTFVNNRLAQIYKAGQWQRAFKKHLGEPLHLPTPRPPVLDQSCRTASQTPE
jgi:glutamate transport system substrate-binding protein